MHIAKPEINNCRRLLSPEKLNQTPMAFKVAFHGRTSSEAFVALGEKDDIYSTSNRKFETKVY